MLSKRVAIILFALISCMGLSAQIYIKGTVVDKDTKKVIPDVIVQYGSSSQAFTYTDAKGQFRIPENSENIFISSISVIKPSLFLGRVFSKIQKSN